MVISAGVVGLHDSESAKQFQALVRKPAKAANGKTETMPGNISDVLTVIQTEQKQRSPLHLYPCRKLLQNPRDPMSASMRWNVIWSEQALSLCARLTGGSFDSSDRGNALSDEGSRSFMRMTCPNCLAVRDIKPKGDRVKFPWNPKRTITPPIRGDAG
jgi:hypothetical protein